MEDIRKDNKPKQSFIFKFLWKHKWKILLTIVIFCIIFFPSFSGKIIGQWFSDFVRNLFEYGKNW